MRLFQLPSLHPNLPPTQPVRGPVPTADAAIVRQQPIVSFGGDIQVGASSDLIIDATLQFAERCTGIIFQGATGTVQVSINSSALRTILADQTINDAGIRQVRIITGALSSVIVQLHGI